MLTITETPVPANIEVMQFEMTSKFFNGHPTYFTSADAPDWLTSAKTIPGSTMDNRWFWKDHVLTLKVGACVQTDFQTIRRIA